MRYKFLQAALITFLLYLIAGVSSPGAVQTTAAEPIRATSDSIVSFLQGSGR